MSNLDKLIIMFSGKSNIVFATFVLRDNYQVMFHLYHQVVAVFVCSLISPSVLHVFG